MRRLIIALLAVFPNYLAAEDVQIHYFPESEGRLTAELVDGVLTYRNERTAMAVLAQVCVSNRKNAPKAERMLRKSGYFPGFYTLEPKGKSVTWLHDGDLPAINSMTRGKIILNCRILINKHPRRFADLEKQLDEATKADLQRYPKDIINYKKGERGWVLRPGFEHAVVILRSSDGDTGIALQYLAD